LVVVPSLLLLLLRPEPFASWLGFNSSDMMMMLPW
jgi:hypothetical protein